MSAYSRLAGIHGAGYAVIAESIVGHMQDDVRCIVAGIRRTFQAVVQNRRLAGLAAGRGITGLGPVAPEPVVAKRIVRYVCAFARGATVNRTRHTVAAKPDAIRRAGALFAFAHLPAILGPQLTRFAVWRVRIAAAGGLVALVQGARIIVFAGDRDSDALELVIVGLARIVAGTGIAVVTVTPFTLPLDNAKTGGIGRVWVTPCYLARMLDNAFMGRTQDATADRVALVVQGTRVAVIAHVPLGLIVDDVAVAGSGIAGIEDAVIQVVVLALHRLAGEAVSGRAHIPAGAQGTVALLQAVKHVVAAAEPGVARIDSAGISVVAIQVR